MVPTVWAGNIGPYRHTVEIPVPRELPEEPTSEPVEPEPIPEPEEVPA